MYQTIIKKHEEIHLEESTHTYTLLKSGIEFNSVTEFINTFFTPFEEEKIAKKLSGKGKYQNMSHIDILNDWENRRNRGTIIHKEIENFINNISKTRDLEDFDTKSKQAILFLEKECLNTDNLLFPEVKICAEKLKYNWKPKEYTNDGLAKIDDKILNSLDYPEAKLLARYFLLEKRIGMLAEGKQAYLKLERNGRLHGTVNTNSAITQRATHSNPNLGQVPAVNVPYGKEFRELFTVPKGKSMCGVDISSLEIRLLGHYIAKYDNGSYANVVVNGDIHTENQKLAGLDTRDQSKRFLYAWLYGAGVNKIAEVTGKSSKDAAQVRTRFLNRLPALSKLIKQVQLSSERGYLIGLDRRQVKIRSVHAALNTLLQSAGAIVCKQWLVEFNKSVKHIEGVQQLLWVHDEIQIECPEDKAEEVGKLAVESIKKTGEHFNLRVPLTGEYKISNDWSGTH